MAASGRCVPRRWRRSRRRSRRRRRASGSRRWIRGSCARMTIPTSISTTASPATLARLPTLLPRAAQPSSRSPGSSGSTSPGSRLNCGGYCLDTARGASRPTAANDLRVDRVLLYLDSPGGGGHRRARRPPSRVALFPKAAGGLHRQPGGQRGLLAGHGRRHRDLDRPQRRRGQHRRLCGGRGRIRRLGAGRAGKWS